MIFAEGKMPEKIWVKLKNTSWVVKSSFGLGVTYVVTVFILSAVWSSEPAFFDVAQSASARAESKNQKVVVGYTTTHTLMALMQALLEKKGGYLSNDLFFPGLWMDNMPAWEFGVLVQVRDLARALRKDLSRSQSQSTEDVDLIVAEPLFHFDSESFWLPDSEGEYRLGLKALGRYLNRLTNEKDQDAQFYARADNLHHWLQDVETRLGSLSQRLSASVGRVSYNVDLAGDTSGQSSTAKPSEIEMRTPWFEIDDVFYEARGSSWALLHLLKAVEVDFKDVLEKRNALVSLRQIIRELEATQQTLWSPMILNGSGMGILANHSLVMANYISRANAGIVDLRELLTKG